MWSDLVWSGFVLSGLVWSGPVFSSLVWSGLSGIVRSDLFYSVLVITTIFIMVIIIIIIIIIIININHQQHVLVHVNNSMKRQKRRTFR